MTTITGWYDPAPKGGHLRLAAHSYLAAAGDATVRMPGLRRGDHVTLADGRVMAVNGTPPPSAGLAERPEFAKLGAVHPSRPLGLEAARASTPRTAEIQRVVDLVCPLGFGQCALIVSPPKAGKTVVLQALRRSLVGLPPDQAMSGLLTQIRRTATNADLLRQFAASTTRL